MQREARKVRSARSGRVRRLLSLSRYRAVYDSNQFTNAGRIRRRDRTYGESFFRRFGQRAVPERKVLTEYHFFAFRTVRNRYFVRNPNSMTVSRAISHE